MKTKVRIIAALLLVFVLVLAFASCKKVDEDPVPTPGDEGIWAGATYKENTELGSGSKTLTVEVKADEKTVIFTVKTDKAIVGDALAEHGLIAGEDGPYGLYVKTVNGMLADYDIDGWYWGFYVNGGYASKGIDMTEIDESAVYRLERTK